MKKLMISFLMAVHNEEKIITKTLKNLISLPYKDYEIILGLDGCTDKTEEIVKSFEKKSKKIKHYNLNIREGKPAVINKIIKKAKGEIIIINDADWIFKVKNKNSLKQLLEIFNDPKVGCIADSFSVQYPARKEAGILEIGVMMQNQIWIDYIKEHGKKINNLWIIANKNFSPLIVNIFRKKLYKQNQTLGDDFERFYDVVNSDLEVAATTDPNLPRMITAGETYKFRELIKIKERTALARNQLKKIRKPIKLLSPGFFFYIIRRIPNMSFKEFFGFLLLNLAFLMGSAKSKFQKNISTKEGWKMRLTR
ncbi:glycosyltransferase family 2 protein [Candidatus Pacearchaeota archaeon]|nr:glycosyltransferase family 2 protein [Candidatus Pacearchaeota archaeon]